MLKLLNNPKSDNTRNILNADLFVSNLHNTLKAFGFNPKVTYEVYRSITVYHITWNDDKIYDDILELKKEIALSLGINVSELVMNKVKDIDADDVKKYVDKNIKKIKKELDDLSMEKVGKMAKKKAKEIENSMNDLVDYVKEKGTPVLEDAVESLRLKAIEVTNSVINKLEKKED